MNRTIAICLLMLLSIAGNGCGINQFADDQQGNADRKMFESDEYRTLRREMWGSGDQPQPLTPYRINRSVQPASSSI